MVKFIHDGVRRYRCVLCPSIAIFQAVRLYELMRYAHDALFISRRCFVGRLVFLPFGLN